MPIEAPKVSIIIAAFNAAHTLSLTLESLQAQEFQYWEAIIVDDGSADATAQVVNTFSATDQRFKLLQQSNKGVSVARNNGIAAAQGSWLLFLDADDLITPDHLARLIAAAEATPEIAAAYCWWARLAPDGTQTVEQCKSDEGDLFPLLARLAAFPIHTCLVRRDLVVELGAFDPSFRTCEEWDLWQRIARTGARFVAVPRVMALYRMQPASASIDGRQMLRDGLRVLATGHGPDERVPAERNRYPQGMPTSELPALRIHYACWPAGVVLGSGGDPLPLLDLLPDEAAPTLDPSIIAETLFGSALLPTCQSPAAWAQRWAELAPAIERFLVALEERCGIAALARRTLVIFARLVLEHAPHQRPLQIDTSYAVRIDLAQPLADYLLPTGVERFYCDLYYAEERVGPLLLPVCDGRVLAAVIADAAAARYAWPLLGHFLARTVYQHLRSDIVDETVKLWRGEVFLASGLPITVAEQPALAHDQIGWTVMLQEIWGMECNGEQLYDPTFVLQSAAPMIVQPHQMVTIEITEPLPQIHCEAATVSILFTVAGALLGRVEVETTRHVVSPGALRVALTLASGIELCNATVREAIIGKPVSEEALRTRLMAVARERSPLNAGTTGQTITLTARLQQPLGSSANRFAGLPTASSSDLLASAASAGEGSSETGTGELAMLVYNPSLMPGVNAINSATATRDDPDLPLQPELSVEKASATIYDRSHFEALFARVADPWRYTGPYEQTKYEQTLAFVPRKRKLRALELACAEGHFTVQLAPLVTSLLCTDISQIALERAAQRCAAFTNIHYQQLDMIRDPIEGQYDVIICSEVLYFMGDKADLAMVAQKIAAALAPGGRLIIAHAHQLIDDPDSPGFDWQLPFGAKTIGETFAAIEGLQLVQELRTPAYRIQAFERTKPQRWPWQRPPQTELISMPQPTALPASVAGLFHWEGGRPQELKKVAVTTSRLPILMYHRVAPGNATALDRYRVTPEAFEEQLRYLRDAGYYSVSLEVWQRAAVQRRPLPGRGVMITFDDGYQDVADYAWPLLKRYGFRAMVFLVAERVGETSSWDSKFSTPVPLMNWETIRTLHAEGLHFGSHSASHAPLTALNPGELVREAARSRALLQQQLGVAIDAFAYPYGDTDHYVQHLVGACGYVYGLSVLPGRAMFTQSLLALPRIEVVGGEPLSQFIARIE